MEDIIDVLSTLPPNTFVGVNNIKAYILNLMSSNELRDRCFNGFVIQPNGEWKVIK